MKIHLLGIGGTGMGSLAGLLLESGHTVTGTDNRLYPPMSDQLAALGIAPVEGYRAENIAAAAPDLVVIGNVIRRDNPEAQEVLRLGLPYRSMPAALAEFFLRTRTPVVIAGTHGKTTASTLAAWLLDFAGQSPGFLIGGVGRNFNCSFRVGRGSFFVVEGDEYDTAFFDKGPKFLHYRPQALLITSIEFDHADIYRDVEAICESFRRLVAIVPPDGLIVANADEPRVMEVVAAAPCRVITCGIRAGKFRPAHMEVGPDGTAFDLGPDGTRWHLPMWGEHNLANAAGVLTLLAASGIPTHRLVDGLAAFQGVRRRQEQVAEVKGIAVIDDFAHHPTAVAKTIASMRQRFPKRRVWAIFEPRSNTSRRNVFQAAFGEALGTADRVIIASPFNAGALSEDERFDATAVAASLMKRGIDAHHIPDSDHIVEFVMRGVEAGDVILLMSNGGFDALPARIADALSRRRIYAAGDEIPRSRVPR